MSVKYTPGNRHGSMERTASPEINPHASSQVIHEKDTRTHKGEKTVSSISGAERTGQLHEDK